VIEYMSVIFTVRLKHKHSDHIRSHTARIAEISVVRVLANTILLDTVPGCDLTVADIVALAKSEDRKPKEAIVRHTELTVCVVRRCRPRPV
jgi:hypothetical protein